ncbi:ankyrin repeat and EF-hand domain-containing protein 1-like [Octopus sinensis]|uniref:Ankyrin repeat and EF-hand domain-containing protein 1-like n=1 Tax=Octopus sinensis TaxID=2607531 RepID=A0A6P7U4J4_9MOLL|nr:ankyrin repeat and EF-hand domain-containing protein 1-like [Octopus sinensis]
MPVAQTPLQIAQVCKLIQLVYEKDKVEIQKLIGEGIPHLINFNEPTYGRTALIVATMSNSDNMLEFLLELGAHPDVVDFQGTSAAMIAAEYGHVQCLERLANNRANMRLIDVQGRGILFYMFTPSQRHYRSYELAIQHGADVNTVAKDGTSALQLGCESAVENEEICLGLLRDGINPDIRPPKTNHTPLMSAAQSGSAKVVKAILEKRGDPNIKDWKRNRAAHFAAAYGHFEVLAALAGYGADFDCANVEGNTALHLAAKGNFTLCCRFLAQRGCNGKFKNSDGCTARMMAKECGNKQAAKECKKGEKLHGKSGKGSEKFVIKFHDWAYVNLEKIRAALAKYDTHKNGVIPAVYLRRVVLSLDAPISYEHLETISKPLEKAGSINAKDFLAGKKYMKKVFQQSSYLPKEKKAKRERPGKMGKFKLPMAICTNSSPRRTGVSKHRLIILNLFLCNRYKRFDRDMPPNHPMQDDSYWYVQVPDVTYTN